VERKLHKKIRGEHNEMKIKKFKIKEVKVEIRGRLTHNLNSSWNIFALEI
jgi:hypothetical protein